MRKINPERPLSIRMAASTTTIPIAGVMRSNPRVRKRRFAAARAILGLFLLSTVADGSWAQTCEEILAARQTLVKVSDQLGRKIAKEKPCSQAQIAIAQKRYNTLDNVIKAGDWIVKNCPGYEMNKAGRDKNISILNSLANFKSVCSLPTP